MSVITGLDIRIPLGFRRNLVLSAMAGKPNPALREHWRWLTAKNGLAVISRRLLRDFLAEDELAEMLWRKALTPEMRRQWRILTLHDTGAS